MPADRRRLSAIAGADDGALRVGKHTHIGIGCQGSGAQRRPKYVRQNWQTYSDLAKVLPRPTGVRPCQFSVTHPKRCVPHVNKIGHPVLPTAPDDDTTSRATGSTIIATQTLSF